jgi:very-short-patch-repair endonuclease
MSNPKSKYWHTTKNGNVNPFYVSKCNGEPYWFLCSCGHDFEMKIESIANGNWCRHCSKNNWMHCGVKDCKMCFNRSFASMPNAKYWDYGKNGDLSPLHVAKRSGAVTIWLKCYKCPHSFDTTPDIIFDGTSWCRYCSKTNWKHCGVEDCKMCFNRSFASNPRSKFIVNLGNKNLLELARFTHDEYIFKCDDCGNIFPTKVCSVSRGNWCPKCKNKTEKKLWKWLKENFPEYTIIHQPKFSWCKNPKTGNELPFDFVIKELGLIIELDGDQHFKQVSTWDPPEKVQNRDIFKMSNAYKLGYKIMRIYQEDVYHDRNIWDQKLKTYIEYLDEYSLLCIDTNKHFVNETYNKYEKLFN